MLYQYHFKQHNRIITTSRQNHRSYQNPLLCLSSSAYDPLVQILLCLSFPAGSYLLASFLAFLSPYYIISHFTTKAYLFLLKGRLLRQTEGSTIVEPFLLSATWTISYTQCFYEKCFQIIHIFRTQVVA